MDVILQLDDELTLGADNDINDVSFTAVVGDLVYGGSAYDIEFSGTMEIVVISSAHVDEDGPIPLTQELDPNTDAIERAVRLVIIQKIMRQAESTVGTSPLLT